MFRANVIDQRLAARLVDGLPITCHRCLASARESAATRR
jgi:hypothetical protein